MYFKECGVRTVQEMDSLNRPSGVAVAASGNVFVVDYGNNRIQQFTNTVTFTRAWEISGNPQAISSLMNLMILNL
jgi:hypothetical protein